MKDFFKGLCMAKWRNIVRSLDSTIPNFSSNRSDSLIKRPSVLVFDGGVGSWPRASGLSKAGFDVTQLGHLRKFPFGKMTNKQLKDMVCDVAVFAKRSGYDALVIASNTPTVMVGEQVRDAIIDKGMDLPIFGVKPPIQQAFERLLQEKKEPRVCVLGTTAMVNSPQMQEYADRLKPINGLVILEDASFLIENHVEGNTSQNEKQNAVFSFMKDINEKHGDIPAFTLSSTHLPILKEYFEKSCPQGVFLDPAVDVAMDIAKVLGLANHSRITVGKINAVYTEPTIENSAYAVADYNRRLNNVAGYLIPIDPVIIEDNTFSFFCSAEKLSKISTSR
jgi:glutamate racemase